MAVAQESRDSFEPKYRELIENLKKTIEVNVDYEAPVAATQPTGQ